MILKKGNALLLTCVCILVGASSAHSLDKSITEDVFITAKAGIVSPASALDGNSGLNIGGSTETFGLVVGKKFMERYIIDAEYSYRGENTSKAYNNITNPENETGSWSAKSNSLMVNLSVNLLEKSAIMPYFRTGLGISQNKPSDYVATVVTSGVTTNNTYAGKRTNEFAYQIGAGVVMNTSSVFDTQLEYMYVNRGKIKTDTDYINSTTGLLLDSSARTGYLKDHVITIGIRYKF